MKQKQTRTVLVGEEEGHWSQGLHAMAGQCYWFFPKSKSTGKGRSVCTKNSLESTAAIQCSMDRAVGTGHTEGQFTKHIYQKVGRVFQTSWRDKVCNCVATANRATQSTGQSKRLGLHA